MQPKEITHAIGIDLGSSYCSVGFWDRDKPHIVYNGDSGANKFCSYVTYTKEGGERLFDIPARAQALRHPKNTPFNIINLLGRDLDSQRLQNLVCSLPFDMKRNEEKNNLFFEA